MSIYDFHRRVLSPEIWKSDEMRPKPKARIQIGSQLHSRFPESGRIFIVGDLAGHYYHEASPLDLIVLAPSNKVEEYRREATNVNGYLLSGTAHGVYFHILADTVKPEFLAEKFGPMFDISMDRWFGKRVTGNTELIRPDALLQRIKWNLYKAKEYGDELFPHDWTIEAEAVRHLSSEGRQHLKNSLQEVIARLEKNIGAVLKSYRNPAIWRNASTLQQLLETDEYEEDIQAFIERNKIPEPVVLAMLNVFRYAEVLEMIEDIDEQLVEEQDAVAQTKGVQLQAISADTDNSPQEIRYKGKLYRQAGKGSSEFMWSRLDNLVTLLIMQNGGYSTALDTVYQIVSRIFDRSRYMNTGMRRRMVALRLYKKYYRHMDV